LDFGKNILSSSKPHQDASALHLALVAIQRMKYVVFEVFLLFDPHKISKNSPNLDCMFLKILIFRRTHNFLLKLKKKFEGSYK
jgi:hypothetical protein